jgi:hypothetical protein
VVFLKRQLPLLICFTVGLLTAVQYYIPTDFSQKMGSRMADWYIVAAMFASLLGFVSVAQVHTRKIQRQEKGWAYSTLVFLGVLAMVIVGFASGGKESDDDGLVTSFGWLYNNTLVPLQGTMFAILGFYVASAAFRSFRAKSLDACVLLATATIVLLGNVPFTNQVWANWLGIHDVAGVRLEMTDIVGWILGNPNTAARRGVTFGVALGAIATSLKIIFGVERAYLGGGD